MGGRGRHRFDVRKEKINFVNPSELPESKD
jgi:hypothetical protein